MVVLRRRQAHVATGQCRHAANTCLKAPHPTGTYTAEAIERFDRSSGLWDVPSHQAGRILVHSDDGEGVKVLQGCIGEQCP